MSPPRGETLASRWLARTGFCLSHLSVTTGYLGTMGIRVVEGRGFQASDATSQNGVALVNEALARRFWPGQTAINRRLRPDGGPGTPWLTVVGVVADVKQGGVSAPAGTELYFCYEQLPQLVDFGLVLAGLGVGLGVAGALATSRFASSLLFGVGPADPVSFTAVLVTMTVVAFAACLLPARRAASVDPMVVLRDE